MCRLANSPGGAFNFRKFYRKTCCGSLVVPELISLLWNPCSTRSTFPSLVRFLRCATRSSVLSFVLHLHNSKGDLYDAGAV
jgi:hypothetical protein